jgi:hypothetical protein
MNYKKDFNSKGHFKNECQCCNDYVKHQEKTAYARGCTIQGLNLLKEELVEELQDARETIQELTDELALLDTSTTRPYVRTRELQNARDTIQELTDELAFLNASTTRTQVRIQVKPNGLVFTEDLPITWKLKDLAIKCGGENETGDTSDSANECIICKDRKSKQIIMSCGHMTCHSCMLHINQRNCPICRTEVEYGKVIFCG